MKGDLGYPGLELLPDGTFIATTYAVLEKGEKQSVVSVRFTMKDLDERGAKLIPKQTDIFVGGTDGYHTYRIPAIVVSKKGTILAFCEARKNSPRDYGDIDMALKRSLDRGHTWQPMQIVWDDGENTIGNPAPVVDRGTGTIWLPFCRNNDRVFVTRSEHDGATWSTPVEITKDVKPAGWTWYATGPCHGIQLSTGRLLIPCDHKEADGIHSHVIYSDDHGATWKLGGSLGPHTDESVAVEAADGSLYLNARNARRANRRVYAWSKDGGLTWSDVKPDDTLIEPTCQASAVRFTDEKTHGKNRVLFSNPASVTRDMMTVRVSYDECRTWSAGKLLWKGPSAYSDLCVLPDLTLAALYERGNQRAYEKITFAQFGLEWLTDGLDGP
ncbi:MAG: exo-alpha-sialidase [Planctomycetes bacterium]|nr:exo-alpha-sialidase [Planctomycetota bacterium]